MQALYDAIGTGYGRTRRADPGISASLASHLQLQPDGDYLDLACGSGNYTLALAARRGRWIGLDESATMLAQARQRASHVGWVRGDARALPLPDSCVDGVICTLALHHFGTLEAPLAELRRVLRPGGRLVVFTAFAEQMQHYWLAHYFPRMLADSAAKMLARAAVESALRGAGFARCELQPFHVDAGLQDLFLYAGKQRPALYLDAAVRANISSFATLCSADELAAGLAALRADLDSGSWAARVPQGNSADGDYAFVIARN
jgi:SAM-dependent methyltransferase